LKQKTSTISVTRNKGRGEACRVHLEFEFSDVGKRRQKAIWSRIGALLKVVLPPADQEELLRQFRERLGEIKAEGSSAK
jgi:hypothetical protein